MIRQSAERKELVIDLMGQEGNAYWLLGYVATLCTRLDQKELIKPIQEDMTSGDYKHLVAVFELNFGDFVTLEADKPLLDEITAEVEKLKEERRNANERFVE